MRPSIPKREKNGPVPDRITDSKASNELKVIQKKPTSVQLRQHERRRKVRDYMCAGLSNEEIARKVGIRPPTVAKDIIAILGYSDFEEEKKKLREKINWDLEHATAHYSQALKEGSKKEARKWFDRRIRINQVMATYLKDTNITVIGKQENTQFIKADLSLILDGIIQKKKEMLI